MLPQAGFCVQAVADAFNIAWPPLATSKHVPLCTLPQINYVTWSPDSKTIAFTLRRCAAALAMSVCVASSACTRRWLPAWCCQLPALECMLPAQPASSIPIVFVPQLALAALAGMRTLLVNRLSCGWLTCPPARRAACWTTASTPPLRSEPAGRGPFGWEKEREWLAARRANVRLGWASSALAVPPCCGAARPQLGPRPTAVSQRHC